MSNEYPIEVRRNARRLWLSGHYTDAEIASNLGISRPDTIRDWRHEEGWTPLADDIAKVIKTETTAAVTRQAGEFRSKYDQLGKALESRAVRAMSSPNLSPRDLKAVAGTLAIAQRIREKAIGAQAAGPDLATQWAELFANDRKRKQRLADDRGLGRCLTTATPGPDGVVTVSPLPPPETATAPAVSEGTS